MVAMGTSGRWDRGSDLARRPSLVAVRRADLLAGTSAAYLMEASFQAAVASYSDLGPESPSPSPAPPVALLAAHPFTTVERTLGHRHHLVAFRRLVAYQVAYLHLGASAGYTGGLET